VRDGDILKQKMGCCGVFTSQRAGLVTTMCMSAIKVEQKGVAKIYDI